MSRGSTVNCKLKLTATPQLCPIGSRRGREDAFRVEKSGGLTPHQRGVVHGKEGQEVQEIQEDQAGAEENQAEAAEKDAGHSQAPGARRREEKAGIEEDAGPE